MAKGKVSLRWIVRIIVLVRKRVKVTLAVAWVKKSIARSLAQNQQVSTTTWISVATIATLPQGYTLIPQIRFADNKERKGNKIWTVKGGWDQDRNPGPHPGHR